MSRTEAKTRHRFQLVTLKVFETIQLVYTYSATIIKRKLKIFSNDILFFIIPYCCIAERAETRAQRRRLFLYQKLEN